MTPHPSFNRSRFQVARWSIFLVLMLSYLLVYFHRIAPGVMSQRIATAARTSGAHAVTGTLHSTDAAMEVVLRRVRAAVEQRDLQLASG